MKPEEFLTELYRLDESKRNTRIIKTMFMEVPIDWMDDIFEKIDTSKLSITNLISFLTASYPQMDKFKYRAVLFNKVFELLSKEKGEDYAKKALVGLDEPLTSSAKEMIKPFKGANILPKGYV